MRVGLPVSPLPFSKTLPPSRCYHPPPRHPPPLRKGCQVNPLCPNGSRCVRADSSPSGNDPTFVIPLDGFRVFFPKLRTVQLVFNHFFSGCDDAPNDAFLSCLIPSCPFFFLRPIFASTTRFRFSVVIRRAKILGPCCADSSLQFALGFPPLNFLLPQGPYVPTCGRFFFLSKLYAPFFQSLLFFETYYLAFSSFVAWPLVPAMSRRKSPVPVWSV